MSALLSVEGLSKSFGAVVVADQTSFQVEEGAAIGILGPNGAGKTSLFNLITGALRADAGRIEFQGRDITQVAAAGRCKMGIARSFQVPHPFVGMTVFENVRCALLWAQGYKYSFWNMVSRSRALTEGAEAVLEQINLTNRRDLPAGRKFIALFSAVKIAQVHAFEVFAVFEACHNFIVYGDLIPFRFDPEFVCGCN